ncbi:maltooligosyl trehalose hydrolase [Sphingomonas sp. OV641]|uniref:malto-oligosyltrehalose trehalohydrolase n=1 Tax=Sphingomonas sp. OV641 TaxID=1881068 RepID=UPI0008B87312|nr:malto-oligosyltrehalose trehalohydrolase [Sphingomonas sp. OV641]SEI88263.1 maltooligosyl trehalose hydrolase [Sphingomonas sp. OV641]
MRWGPEALADGTTRFRLWAPDADTVAIEIGDAATDANLLPGKGRGPVGKAPEKATNAPQLDPGLRRGTADEVAPPSPPLVLSLSKHVLQATTEVGEAPFDKLRTNGGDDTNSDRVPLTPTENGWWEITLPPPPGTPYRYHIANTPFPDPASRRQQGGVHGWSIVPDHSYPWRTPEWRGRPWHEMVVMELHAGTLGGFSGVLRRLPALAALGVTAIQLMPINAFAGDRGWGYDGVLPYAVHEAYGTPTELRALIDAAHELGLSVFLDVVYNHFGPDGNYLGLYADRFFHRDVATPWGGAVAVDEAPVACFFIDNALMWLKDYRFDGLRFDAVHAIDNPQFLDKMAAEIRAALPDRHVHLVLENEQNDAARLRPDAYDAQWNDDFHNVLHVLLTGETSAYYGDFADRPAERLARCLSEGFIYQGDPSPNHDGKPRGTPSAHLPPIRFVSFLQNHDQVGNRALGERLTRLTDPAKLRAATALMLLAPQIPLLFMGEEEGSESPFLFFTDFHDDLADAVREGRRKEFAKFEAFADEKTRETIPDPNALSTFEASIPQPGPDAGTWRSFYQTLLHLRRDHIAPRLSTPKQHPVEGRGPVGKAEVEASPLAQLDPGLRRGTVESLGAQATGNTAVTARWRLNDGKVLAIAIDLADAPAPLPTPPFAPTPSVPATSTPSPFVPSEVEARAKQNKTLDDARDEGENGLLFTTDNRFIAWLE